jgi:hypothetical protein
MSEARVLDSLLIARDRASEADRFRSVYARLGARLEAADFAGADPFDALNSTVFGRTPLVALPFARLAWLQLFKRSPYDLRKIFRVPATANPVTLALAARTYLRAGDAEKARRCVARLLGMRCDPTQWGEGAWGYPFAWQARAFYVPFGVPNVIATAYALRAVIECASVVEGEADRIVAAAATLVASTLVRRARNGGRFIGYVPQADTMVHNASLWGAYVLAVAARRGGAPAWRALADAAIDHTIGAQTADGAWAYGEAPHHRWIDGFHTGYVLEALQLCRVLLDRSDLDAPIAHGIDYYITTFVRDDGVVPYYADGKGPLDANNFAQMVITLYGIRPQADWPSRADKVLAAAIRELWCPELQSFAYQRSGKRLNTVFYPRWTQIWMLHALGLRLDREETRTG